MSLGGVDENIFKIIFVTDMCRQNFPINNFLINKRGCMFFENFLEVADTHTQVFSPIPRILSKIRGLHKIKKNKTISAFLPLFDSLMAQGFRQV